LRGILFKGIQLFFLYLFTVQAILKLSHQSIYLSVVQAVMVVIIPKKRQCKKCFSVGYVSLLLSAALLICYLTGVKMTAWNDFIGQGAQGLEGGKASLFPRSLSPLYDYQRTLWGGAEDSSMSVGSEVKGAGARVVTSAKVKRGTMVDSGGGKVGVVSAKGNFNIDDLSGKHSLTIQHRIPRAKN
jgi:hypothetical protein